MPHFTTSNAHLCAESVIAAGFGGAIDNAAILEFVDAGHSVLVAVDSDVADEQRELISDFGVDLEPAGHVVIDHFHHANSDPDHAAITADDFVGSKGVWGEAVPPVRSQSSLLHKYVPAWHSDNN